MDQPLHSSLGASSAERWLQCPGSVALLKQLQLPESDEEEWRASGTAAHELGALCLREGSDAWEHMGEKFHGMEANEEMTLAVQTYLDYCRSRKTEATIQVFIEHRVALPEVHELFYGTLDYCLLWDSILEIVDYKHGMGVVVEVEDNPQLMYYAYGVLKNRPEIKKVRMTIAQPRVDWHPDGKIRSWTIDADYIREWAEKTLVPGMLRTALDDTLMPGEWCRFCPAKLVCPVLTNLFGACVLADPKQVISLTDSGIARDYVHVKAVKFYIKALEGETLRRMSNGTELSDLKLVYQKANRVWKDEAEEVFKARYGEEAYTAPAFKSPATMEEIADKELVKTWAYTPHTQLTVALASDKRPSVKVESPERVFAKQISEAANQEDMPELPKFLDRGNKG